MRFLIAILVNLLFWSAAAFAQTGRQLVQDKPGAQKRTALVIGNAKYQFARTLANPVNDATDMSAALKELGFEVITGTDLTHSQMREKVREFGDKLRVNGGVGLFYYAGHGVQVSGINYLIPVEADIPREDEIVDLAFRLNGIFEKMNTANNGFNIVILDACRNNPFARSWSRSTNTDGLAQVTAPTGTFIAYSTSPDNTANDGTSVAAAEVKVERVNSDGSTKKLGTLYTNISGEFAFRQPEGAAKFRITAKYKDTTASKEIEVDSAAIYRLAISLDVSRQEK